MPFTSGIFVLISYSANFLVYSLLLLNFKPDFHAENRVFLQSETPRFFGAFFSIDKNIGMTECTLTDTRSVVRSI